MSWLGRCTGLRHSSNQASFPATTFFALPPQMSNALPHNPAHENKRFMQPVKILAPNAQFNPGVAQSGNGKALTIQASVQIKAAEYWLKLGEADQALRELEALPSRFWKCGWALKTRIAAMGALRERDEMAAQA